MAQLRANSNKPYEAIKNQDEDDEPLMFNATSNDQTLGTNAKPREYKEQKLNEMKTNELLKDS